MSGTYKGVRGGWWVVGEGVELRGGEGEGKVGGGGGWAAKGGLNLTLGCRQQCCVFNTVPIGDRNIHRSIHRIGQDMSNCWQQFGTMHSH